MNLGFKFCFATLTQFLDIYWIQFLISGNPVANLFRKVIQTKTATASAVSGPSGHRFCTLPCKEWVWPLSDLLSYIEIKTSKSCQKRAHRFPKVSSFEPELFFVHITMVNNSATGGSLTVSKQWSVSNYIQIRVCCHCDTKINLVNVNMHSSYTIACKNALHCHVL